MCTAQCTLMHAREELGSSGMSSAHVEDAARMSRRCQSVGTMRSPFVPATPMTLHRPPHHGI